MLETEITMNRFLLQYARMLMRDIPDERMAEQPLPGVNHPAWILGHLAYSADQGLGLLGCDKTLTAEWKALFSPETTPVSSRTDYPSKTDLLRMAEQQFDLLRQQAAAADTELLSRPSNNPYTRDWLPTINDGVAFLLTGHLGVHLGQLSTWRRMIGMRPLF